MSEPEQNRTTLESIPYHNPYRMVAFKRQKFLQIFNLNSAMYSLDYNLKGYEVKN